MLCADKQPGEFMVHFTIYFHICHGNSRNEVVRGGHRRVVEERTVLGDRRRIGSLVCRLPRPAEGVRRYRHQLHCHSQVSEDEDSANSMSSSGRHF